MRTALPFPATKTAPGRIRVLAVASVVVATCSIATTIAVTTGDGSVPGPPPAKATPAPSATAAPSAPLSGAESAERFHHFR
jgi:hypothetical protein